MSIDSFHARASLRSGDKEFQIFRLQALAGHGITLSRLPWALRILLEKSAPPGGRRHRHRVRYPVPGNLGSKS